MNDCKTCIADEICSAKYKNISCKTMKEIVFEAQKMIVHKAICRDRLFHEDGTLMYEDEEEYFIKEMMK